MAGERGRREVAAVAAAAAAANQGEWLRGFFVGRFLGSGMI